MGGFPRHIHMIRKKKIMYRLTLHEESTLSGAKPVHEENCQGIKLRIAHKIKRLKVITTTISSRLSKIIVSRFMGC